MGVFNIFKRQQRKEPMPGYYESQGGYGEPRFSAPRDPYQQQQQPSLFMNAAQSHQAHLQGQPYNESQPRGGYDHHQDRPFQAGYPRDPYPGDYTDAPLRSQQEYHPQHHQSQAPQGREHPRFDQGYTQPQNHQTPPQFSQRPHQDHFTAQPSLQGTPANYPHGGGGQDVRDLGFWDKSPAAYDERYDDRYQGRGRYAEDDDENEPQPLRFVLALGILIIFAAVAWLVFKWSTQTVSTTPPHIQADPAPFKVRPDNPGGMIVPHQDKLVYGRIGHEGSAGAEGAQPVERLLPPPEQPVNPGVNAYGPQPGSVDPNYAQGYANVNPQGQPVQSPGVMQQGGVYPAQPMQQGQIQAPQPVMVDQNGNVINSQNVMIAPVPQQGVQQGMHVQQGGGFVPPMMPIPQNQTIPPQGVNPQVISGPMGSADGGDSESGANFYPNNQNAQQVAPIKGVQEKAAKTSAKDSEEKTKKDLKARDVKQVDKKNKKDKASNEMATGYLPGGLPAKKQAGSTPAPATQDSAKVKNQAQGQTAQTLSTQPKLYKVKLAAVATKVDAEKEWERLRFDHRDAFQSLNKAILEKKSNGRTFFVVYGLGVKNQKEADAVCRAVGAGCTYEPQ